MDSKGQALLRLLFNPGESVCPSPDKFAYRSIPLEQALDEEVTLISNNPSVPSKTCKTSDLILCAINPINGERNDNNVTAFRSFLIELDVGEIKTQLNTIKHLGLPFSAQTFSGNKSVHTVITLDEDLPTRKHYDKIAEWLLKIITLADKNCKNPSRGIRMPSVIRDNGKKQRLIELKNRVSHKELFAFLNKYEHLRPEERVKIKNVPGQADFSLLETWIRVMLIEGIDFKNRGRNNTWMAIAYGFAKAGFSEEDCISELRKRFESEHDFKEKEFLKCISQGYKHWENKKV